MKAKERYLTLFSAAFWTFLLGWHLHGRQEDAHGRRREGERSAGPEDAPARDWMDVLPPYDRRGAPRGRDDRSSSPPPPPPPPSCDMDTCFDFSLCSSGPPFLHHVYPWPAAGDRDGDGDGDGDGDAPVLSPIYSRMLSLLRDSPLHTDDPDRACLFVLAVDTLDRDRQGAHFDRSARARLEAMPGWRNGTNHVVFNLYSGSYPDYGEDDLGFHPGRAILARASTSGRRYRAGFDISLPLFHASHPARDQGRSGSLASNIFPVNNGHLLAFKARSFLFFFKPQPSVTL